MKTKLTIFLIMLTMLVSKVAYAGSWYVVNEEDKVMVQCDYEPDSEDIASRNEIKVYSDE